MFKDDEKFSKEIKALKAANFGPALHPLRKQQIKQAVLLSLEEQGGLAPPSIVKEKNITKFIRALIAASVGILTLAGTAFAANDSKPGDVFFPVKKIAEQIQVKLATTEEGKAKLQTKFAEKRLSELAEINSLAKNIAGGNTAAEIKAKVRAADEIKNALADLQAAELNLKAKGDADAATVVDKTIVLLKTSLQAGAGSENNPDESLKYNEESASSSQESRPRGTQEGEDKKDSQQQKKSDKENTVRSNAPDNKNSERQNYSTTSAPLIIDRNIQGVNKDAQDHRQEHAGEASTPVLVVPNATSTPAKKKRPAADDADGLPDKNRFER